MGEPTLIWRMWGGMPVRSSEERNSTRYCTASPSLIAVSTSSYTFSSPGQSFMSNVLSWLTFAFRVKIMARSASHSGLVMLVARLGRLMP